MEIKSYTTLLKQMRHPNQRRLEWIGSLFMSVFMLLSVYSFSQHPSEVIFRDSPLSPLFFAFISGLGAVGYILLLTQWVKRRHARTKWILWSLCGSSIVLYTIPVGAYLYSIRNFNIAIVVYFAIYFLISFAGACLHRE
jgi:drug/metabolite transporter (DMT)-like permease